jgi:hypothetical protein
MPIRPELRQFYGADHRRLRAELIAQTGPHCWECKRVMLAYLNLAHMRHDPRDPSQVELLCPSCHAAHDAPHRIAVMRRRRAKKHGQLWLLEEIEWDPYPSWQIREQIPARVADRVLQGWLF